MPVPLSFSLVNVRADMPQPLSRTRWRFQKSPSLKAFKEAGYATFFAGKWHLGPNKAFWPEHQGFDVNRGGWNAGAPFKEGKYFTPYANPRLEDGPPGEHLPERLASETIDFMEA